MTAHATKASTARAESSTAGRGRGVGIEIKELFKIFEGKAGEVVAIDGIDLSIRPGEFVCLVGPSGCGKSTLLRILARLETADAGSAIIDAGDAAVENAMVFQEASIFPWMSVATNVGFGLDTRGVAKLERDRRVDDALRLVGLTKFRNHYPHQLSGGMKQRAAIARAFVTDPAVLLMDEPFAALDAQNRQILQDELLRIWEETGKTVVYVTHSIEEALMLGDRAVLMTAQPGRIKEIIEIPFARPRNIYEVSTTQEFARLKLRIWRILEEEVLRARKELEGL